MTILEVTRSELVQVIERRTAIDGRMETVWPGLGLVRSDVPTPRVSLMLEPGLFVVAQGRKRAYLGQEVFTYDPLHYLVSSVPLPIESEIVEASPDRPYLAL